MALIAFGLFLITIVSGTIDEYVVPTAICPFYKNGPSLDTNELVGSWMTVYTQPKRVKCFNIHIRTITDLEREQYIVKYGNFSNRVNWNTCFLELVSSQRKHYLQGDGTLSGMLENIFIFESTKGNYSLQDQSADQWFLYGRRGNELLLMRDCADEIVALFARIAYWPTPTEVYAVLHRSGIPATAQITEVDGGIDVSDDQAPDQEESSIEQGHTT
ncbi:uncharacterized protein LOC113233008 isoform X2 [Hyposmocoma kahamanoa]|uniref:uncharacterized protein LOC113233008 isoform X2 n=1 Tax=Hyposmocoma kahamanoa TaxID=1477025 RepID=UPI000E6D8D1D|nr:uncharacterized protein LOC113233008 isoform X2 [Hyposmocoma kahamanoa]